ncbi:NAD(P)/FAD-dependent oxidoreductase [Pigmentiphaga soli]|uniref:NAD(P)/FAD-dependent oxidoreductase n=2 Tax=Pigmentiphaga soli TaxID=1007095 RepID=A0ABP8GTT8_9BURK
MNEQCDLAIVGAGPAGMAAAIAAAECGLSAIVADEQFAPGGQIYRGIEAVAASRPQTYAACGEDYAKGLDLVRAFRDSGARYRSRASVWRIDEDRTVYWSDGERSHRMQARSVLIATGAIERPVPIPGWTLPGVHSCGGAQILFKSADLAPGGRTVLAGSGVLLFLYAWQLLRRGVAVDAILETTPPANYARAARHLPGALAAAGYLRKGLQMIHALKRAGIPIERGASSLRAVGKRRVERIEYRAGGRARSMPVDTLLVHEGVVPHVNLAFSIGCETAWDPVQLCFRPVLQPSGETSVPGVFVAGDGAGIAGAVAAQHGGTLAGLSIAKQLGAIDDARMETLAAVARAQLKKHLCVRPFLDTLYQPAREVLAPSDPDTIVCRCEEVSAGQIRKLAAEGCAGPNQLKAFVRCGMGPCQGRLCGLTVAGLLAEARGKAVAEIGHYRVRSPVKPITVGQLAGLDDPMEGV